MTTASTPARGKDFSAGYEGPVRAPRGTEITAANWLLEAPKRMLMNNLDEEVAEAPEQLVVYGGTGRAARSWPPGGSPWFWSTPTASGGPARPRLHRPRPTISPSSPMPGGCWIWPGPGGSGCGA